MKYLFSFLFTALCLATTCTVTTTAQTILDVLIASPNHTLLTGAITAASPEFAEIFARPDVAFTLFAPDNAAVATVDQEYMQFLLTPPWVDHCKCVAAVCVELTVSSVRRVYLYPASQRLTFGYETSLAFENEHTRTVGCVLLAHLHIAVIASANITGPVTVNSGMPDYPLNLDGPDPFTVNEIPVSVADIVASNGVIHSLSTGVLLPPCVTQDLYDALIASPTLTMLAGLITDAGLVDGLRLPATAAGLTILAPTNAAFASLDPALFETIANDPAILTQVLSYHMIPANYNGTWTGTLASLQGETVNMTLENEVLKFNDATSTSDTGARNGLIYEIDTVLIPSSLQELPTDPITGTPPPLPSQPPSTDTGTEQLTILDLIVASPNHTMLAAAITVADPIFADLFSDPVAITLFAPDNAAVSLVDQGYLELLFTPPWVNHCKCYE
jgi:uncharacterized surface protein with fasciclin (FAS1) repeats